MEKKISVLAMSVFLLAAMYFLAKEAAIYTMAQNTKEERIVVIDVGHGGKDPGKVGVDQSLEKDINLAIALKLETFLQQSDLTVVLTRRDDSGLYDEDASNKKVQDMRRRVALIEELNADLVVSIHQNSYADKSVRGPQCFFYTNSKEGEEIAFILQDQLNTGLKIEHPRNAKPNDSYYMLKKSSVPTVIAECGFLSSPEDAALLNDEIYQEKMAWNLYLGILQYFNAE
ncbi:MAG: N-acetylmuramoyl-L-alanine amidase [Lachnospiraceae bacterium]|nr:N-acetylmuramoyl-L-alanine amidase [Lachnospiraceae bacterium]